MAKMAPSSVLVSVSETADKPLAKTQRNLKNVERAFIAASRRTDRDPEARLHSARRASKIHKQRTGKGLKISREIVLREEMYEEEEDDMPRSLRAFAANPHGSSNYPPNADMAKIARQVDIERRFAEQFPTLQLSRRGQTQPGYPLHQGPPQLHVRTTSVPQFRDFQRGGADSGSQVSPLVPPVSYPLPPTPQQSRSISPVALGSSTTRPGSANSDPLPGPLHTPGELASMRRWTMAGIPDDPSLQPPLFGMEMAPGPLPLPWELPQQQQPTNTIGMPDLSEFKLPGSGQEPYTQNPYPDFQTSTPVQHVYPAPSEWQPRDGFASSLDTFAFEPAAETAAVTSMHGSPSQSPTSPVAPTSGTGTATPNVSWASWLNIDDDIEPTALGSMAPLGASGLPAQVVSAQV